MATTPEIEATLAWAKGLGLVLSGLAVAGTPDAGLGLMATRYIGRGELVMRVPHSLLVTGSNAQLGGTNALAMRLLEERAKGATSHWRPYVNLLPKGDFGTPLFFNDSEKKELHGTDVLRWSLARESNVARTHRFLRDEGMFSSFELGDLAWALSIAWSRGFAVNMRSVRAVEGTARRPGLVPFGDFYNHAPESYANIRSTSDPGREVFEYYASRPLNPGDEALISYSLHGEPSNSKLLLDYGFCVPYSLHDEVSVALFAPTVGVGESGDVGADRSAADAQLARAQLSLLRALELDQYARAARLTLEGNSRDPPPQLVASGRVLALTLPQLARATPQSVLGDVSSQFEVRALQLLASRLASRLDEYSDQHERTHERTPTPSNAPPSASWASSLRRYEEDERTLAGGAWKHSSGAGCALHVRTGERRILLHWLHRIRVLVAEAEAASAAGAAEAPEATQGEVMPMEPTWEPADAGAVGVGVHPAGAVSDARSSVEGYSCQQEDRRCDETPASHVDDANMMVRHGELLHTFRADAIGWDPELDTPLRQPTAAGTPLERRGRSTAELEVRRIIGDVRGGGAAQSGGDALRGVVVGAGGRVLRGQLLGCYTGRVLGPEERAAKRATSESSSDAYTFPINATHVVDPTAADGSLPSNTPHNMALVNEPRGDMMPNVWPMEYQFGTCRDRDGRPGVPYYAAREILGGEEIVVCYGPRYDRSRYTAPSMCADAVLLARWSALQDKLLRPLLSG